MFKARRNAEKERIYRLLSIREARAYEQGQGSGPAKLTDLSDNRDTLLYYGDVLASPTYVFYDSVKLQMDLRLEELGADSTRRFLFSGDTLLVSYQDTIEATMQGDVVKRAKHYRNLPREQKQSYHFFRTYKPSRQQFTMLYLLEGGYLTIEKNGYYRELDFLFEDGYMAWKKVAHLLPWDYDPRKDAWAEDH